MCPLRILQFTCRTDNFGILLHDEASGLTAAIDAPEEKRVRDELQKAGLKLTHIFTTHAHFDHVDGHLGLKAETGCVIYGSQIEKEQVPGLDHALREGDEVAFGAYKVRVMETPGHTRGHLSFFIPDAAGGNRGVAFTGDTLFSVGCGRVIEGLHDAMFASLEKIAKLSPQTQIYCGHEYTAANIAFALSVEPDNEALRRRHKEVEDLRAQGKASLPVSLEQELATNPFLRTHSTRIRNTFKLDESASGAQVFEALRRKKDRF